MNTILHQYQDGLAGTKSAEIMLSELRDFIPFASQRDECWSVSTLDVVQAFDRLNTKYLKTVLMELQVHHNFINTIMCLLNERTLNINVNQQELNAIKVNNGIAPLSVCILYSYDAANKHPERKLSWDKL